MTPRSQKSKTQTESANTEKENQKRSIEETYDENTGKQKRLVVIPDSQMMEVRKTQSEN